MWRSDRNSERTEEEDEEEDEEDERMHLVTMPPDTHGIGCAPDIYR